MKREKEIKKYCADQGFPYGACSSISSLKADIATDAIKWADKTMIDKACEWLSKNIDDYCDNGGYGVVISVLLKDFRKAMEDEL